MFIARALSPREILIELEKCYALQCAVNLNPVEICTCMYIRSSWLASYLDIVLGDAEGIVDHSRTLLWPVIKNQTFPGPN